MIIYNVTVKVDALAHDEWLQWMREVHIPEVIATGYFTEHKICRILGQEDEEGMTYAIQYFCNSMSDYEFYKNEHAERLQKDHMDKFKDRYMAFRTLMEEV